MYHSVISRLMKKTCKQSNISTENIEFYKSWKIFKSLVIFTYENGYRSALCGYF